MSEPVETPKSKQLEVIDFHIKHGVRCFPGLTREIVKDLVIIYEKEVENPNGLVRKTLPDCELRMRQKRSDLHSCTGKLKAQNVASPKR